MSFLAVNKLNLPFKTIDDYLRTQSYKLIVLNKTSYESSLVSINKFKKLLV